MDLSNEFCSQACQQEDVGVAGSALNPGDDFAGYILVEHEGNWERKLKKQKDYLKTILKKLDRSDKDFRLQAIQHDEDYCKEGILKVIWYRSTDNPQFYEQVEFDVPHDNILEFIDELLANPETKKYKVDNYFSHDILVCIHTRRDRCCGKFGYPIYKALRTDQVPNTRIWRTSHVKGHRTAPTMVDLPQGRFWGYMTTHIARKVRDQRPLTDAEWDKHYRGLVNLYPGEQMTDREALKKFGWVWTEDKLIVKSKKFKDRIRATLESSGNKVTVDFSREEKKTKVGKTRCQTVKVKELQILDTLIN